MSSPHRQTLLSLVRRHGWTSGAELGVNKGLLFHLLLSSVPDLHLTGVDVFPLANRREKCEAICAKYADRARLLVMRTDEACHLVPNRSLDFVFIDADHSYDAVVDDIVKWTPKVKRGGWVGGHDYNLKWPGVVQAVDEAFGKRVRLLGPGSIWGVWR